ncbi:hypothetical protein WwAna0897 [Wolbachia endosymbiont of Drosophila ananassae]|nr:hypothetical protein WwAna0897 [Wolbachia endosymbiont of Drosophila ananassae]
MHESTSIKVDSIDKLKATGRATLKAAIEDKNAT